MSHQDMTPTEMFESLNGFEEIAITKAFGKPITTLQDEAPLMFARALVFVARKREGGLTDLQAKQAAMEITLKQVGEAFAPEPEDMDADDPDSDSGKGDA